MLFCVCMCVWWSPAADSWGQTRSKQTFGALNNVFVCVRSVSGWSDDWLVDRKCHLNRSQKCISIERFPSCPYWALTSAHSLSLSASLSLSLSFCLSGCLCGCLTASFPSLNTQRQSFTADGKRSPWNYFCCGFSFKAVLSFNWKLHLVFFFFFLNDFSLRDSTWNTPFKFTFKNCWTRWEST